MTTEPIEPAPPDPGATTGRHLASVSDASGAPMLADERIGDIAITPRGGYHRHAAASATSPTVPSPLKVGVHVAGVGANARADGPSAGTITIVK
ncbi:MAG: hypothetical protein HY264_01150 [Chloroflexi bacterium]|nr:hypothetical protein [Chloroflexota bacterium]